MYVLGGGGGCVQVGDVQVGDVQVGGGTEQRGKRYITLLLKVFDCFQL